MAVLDAGAARAAAGPRARRAPERCECSFVEDALLRGRPGLSVVQTAWHPGTLGTHLEDPVCMWYDNQLHTRKTRAHTCAVALLTMQWVARWSVRLSEAGPA